MKALLLFCSLFTLSLAAPAQEGLIKKIQEIHQLDSSSGKPLKNFFQEHSYKKSEGIVRNARVMGGSGCISKSKTNYFIKFKKRKYQIIHTTYAFQQQSYEAVALLPLSKESGFKTIRFGQSTSEEILNGTIANPKEFETLDRNFVAIPYEGEIQLLVDGNLSDENWKNKPIVGIQLVVEEQ